MKTTQMFRNSEVQIPTLEALVILNRQDLRAALDAPKTYPPANQTTTPTFLNADSFAHLQTSGLRSARIAI